MRYVGSESLAPGVEYREFALTGSHGPVYGHLLTVDLREPRAEVGLVYPGTVGARAAVSALADAGGAVGAVNGDFFNISETQHPGVAATGAPVGPAVADGRWLKAAVPDGQRFGPPGPPGTGTRDVIGVGTDRTARIGSLTLRGTVHTKDGALPLRGFNQYAVAENGIGAFTPVWGAASRVRATCGSDADRAAPCTSDTYEVTVTRGRVAKTAAVPGGGPIAADSVVLVGREAGAGALRALRVGDPVTVDSRPQSTSRVPFAFAVGGFPIVRDDEPLDGLDSAAAAVRTAAGIGDGGRRLYLLALDGDVDYRPGLTVAELADTMLDLGADDAFNLDGGGSTTLVTREAGSGRSTVRNHPSGGAERPVANGIGVFAGPRPQL
ncbi:phosphodiester glycosidase family protein [Streptomyces sp. B1866]|uniref:phosphodiester glycosidase family protein n=1 Tax=Streptomyces sp. B1866 TaxID=3075431 RepID=UPI0028916708|nr:phosphodiester glycosidase family protein [Streptomyces sp. B1866]MDT3400064.1 phosphodiester glycosidase family protein [Streptomyces sp. B1866]